VRDVTGLLPVPARPAGDPDAERDPLARVVTGLRPAAGDPEDAREAGDPEDPCDPLARVATGAAAVPAAPAVAPVA
jgi:hypothetical protein